MTVIDAAELESLLRAHGFLTVERPPVLWSLHTTGLESFVRALGESIAAALVRNGNDLAAVTLGVSNIVDDEGREFVGVTLSGAGAWAPEATWRAGSDVILAGADLTAALSAAGAVFGYVRDLGDGTGSVTAWYPRARPVP